MSAEDYDACEKLFCGTWQIAKNENVEEFLAASGMTEQMKGFARQEDEFVITRDGNAMIEKTKVGGVEFAMKVPLGEEFEWKDNQENPIFHVKVIANFKDGVWTQASTLLNVENGKTQVMKCKIEGGEFVVDFSLPDVPGVTAKRIFKKV